MLKSIVLKKNANTFQLMCLTISYVIKKFKFMFKQLCKSAIQSFIHLLNFYKNNVLIE